MNSECISKLPKIFWHAEFALGLKIAQVVLCCRSVFEYHCICSLIIVQASWRWNCRRTPNQGQQWEQFFMAFVVNVYMKIHLDLSLLLLSVSTMIITEASRRCKCAGTPSQENLYQCYIPSTYERTLNASFEFVPCLQSPLLECLSFVIHDEGSAEGTNVRLLTASMKETLGMLSMTERYVSCPTWLSTKSRWCM